MAPFCRNKVGGMSGRTFLHQVRLDTLGARLAALFVLTLLISRCSSGASCDLQCQEEMFSCFHQLRSCEQICSLPEGKTLQCLQFYRQTEEKTLTSKLSSFHCDSCKIAFERWTAGKDCEEGQSRCAYTITVTGLVGHLLQKCVKIQGRLTWSDGRRCDSNDRFPCVEVDNSMQCLGCGVDADCSKKEQCSTSRQHCVACANDADCPKVKPLCSSSGRCVTCTTDKQCKSSFSGTYCIGGSCLCEQNSDCQLAGYLSCSSLGRCEQCKTDADCPVDVFGPSTCSNGRCIGECSEDKDCAVLNRGVCASGRCLPGCSQHSDCEALNLKFCDSGRCRQCLSNDDCTSLKEYCHPTSYLCVHCLSNSDCPPNRPVCDPRLFYCKR